jgi:hypothetical protein
MGLNENQSQWFHILKKQMKIEILKQNKNPGSCLEVA